MNILFRCITMYQCFIASMIIEIHYQNDNTILLVDNTTVTNHLCKDKQIIKSKIWDKVVEIQREGASISQTEESIQNLISENHIDKYHFFTWGDSFSRFIFNRLPDSTKVILTDEGIATYRPLLGYGIFEKQNMNLYNPIDVSRFEEIWLLEPLLYDDSLNIPVQKIDFLKIFNHKVVRKSFLDKINTLFNFNGDTSAIDMLYFDGYYSFSGLLPLGMEKTFLNHLFHIVSDYKCVVKLHPTETKQYSQLRYEGINPPIFTHKSIPWEVYYVNLKENKNLTLVTISSTAVLSSLILSEASQTNIAAIFLDQLMVDYLGERGEYLNLTDLVEKIKKLKPNLKIYQPKTWEELKQNIYQIYVEPNILEREVLSDHGWFQQEYQRLTNYFGNTVTVSSVLLSGNNSTVTKKVCIDYSHVKQKIIFDLSEDYIGGNTEVLWKPYENNIFNKIKIDSLVLVDSLENEIKLPYHCLDNKNNIDSDGNLYIDKNNPYVMFQIDTGNIIKKMVIEFTPNLNHQQYDNFVHYKHLNEKAQGYYEVLLKWTDTKQFNIDIKKYFIENKYTRIGIYGNGELGTRFFKEIKEYSQHIFYISSELSYYPSDEKETCVYSIHDFIEKEIECDVIVVTPTFDYYSIMQRLRKSGFDKDIVSIDTVFNVLLGKENKL